MTIAAIATPNGVGAISIIRLSGTNAVEIANKVIKKDLSPRIATLSKIYDLENNLIDVALVIYFKAPNSFTGEDIVEFQCHGGVVVSKILLENLLKAGARLAEAGEFTKRAFLNGKIDASKAEAIAKLIETKSREGAKLLARQLEGDLVKFVDDIRNKLIEIMAYSEVFMIMLRRIYPKLLEKILRRDLTELKIF